MATLKNFIVASVMVLGIAGTAGAQISKAEAEQIHVRQQISSMELQLQQAVVHGADLVYAQFRAVFRDSPRLASQPRVSGFTLPGYGMVFTVDVPTLQVPLLWEVVMREQEIRNATMQLQRMRAQFSGMNPGRERDKLLENIEALEQQLGLGNLRATEGGRTGPNGVTLVPAGIPGGGIVEQRIADDPEAVYSREVKAALIDAMLTNSQGLSLGPDEWLTVTAMAREANNAAPGASVESSRGIIRVKGSVLNAFRMGTITKEEARKQVEIIEQ